MLALSYTRYKTIFKKVRYANFIYLNEFRNNAVDRYVFTAVAKIGPRFCTGNCDKYFSEKIPTTSGNNFTFNFHKDNYINYVNTDFITHRIQ